MQQHVWLTDEFSVRIEDLCWKPKGPIARCVHGKGHAGPCKFDYSPDVRLYAHSERRK